MRRRTTHRLMTQNVRGFPAMSQRKVLADVLRSGRDAGVIGWQEIQHVRYRRAIRVRLGGGWGHYFGPNGDGTRDGGAPISWRESRWLFVKGGSQLLHPGKAGVCKARFIVWVILRCRDTGLDVAFTNAHYVPGAWTARPVIWKKWRRDAWNQGNRTHRELVAGFREEGLPTCTFGDFNRRNFPVMGTRVRNGGPFRYLNPANSIDYVITTDGTRGRWRVRKIDTRRDRHSDHAGRRARVFLVRRKGV